MPLTAGLYEIPTVICYHRYYLNGNWGKASEYLKKAENFFSNDNNGAMDGPTHILLNRIKSFEIENNNALESKSLSPHSWRGYFDWNNRS